MTEKDVAWELRHFERVAACLPVGICFPRTDDVWHKTTTFDCSGGGVAIAWRAPLPRGMTVELQISLPNRRVVRTRAKVAFARAQATVIGSYWIGLEFVKMPDSERTPILRLVMDARCCRSRTG